LGDSPTRGFCRALFNIASESFEGKWSRKRPKRAILHNFRYMWNYVVDYWL